MAQGCKGTLVFSYNPLAFKFLKFKLIWKYKVHFFPFIKSNSNWVPPPFSLAFIGIKLISWALVINFAWGWLNFMQSCGCPKSHITGREQQLLKTIYDVKRIGPVYIKMSSKKYVRSEDNNRPTNKDRLQN